MLKNFARKCLYACGALGLYHRLRNADSLTVVMFHRTLRPDDPRWGACDPDYTLSDDLFRRSIAFFAKHYHVVTLAQVLRARREGAALPPRALLITFDDGWRDNVDYALPALQRASLPAAMFVAADAVGARQPFYQERIIGAWRRHALDVPTLAGAVGVAAQGEGLPAIRRLIAVLEAMTPDERARRLQPLAMALDDGLQHMIERADLRTLREGGVELGLHGKRHLHITRAPDPDEELSGAREAMAGMLDAPEGTASIACATMSFPHGAYDDAVAARARDSGYELLFTSVPVLNAVDGGPSWLLGRTGYETDTIADARGRFRPEKLAWYLFRREIRRLA
jgi:peptidoglycan/xylan/chitin deacetylase (PgdA/CDA1 family)